MLAVLAMGLVASGVACGPRARHLPSTALDAAAERYARLALAMGRHDPDYVDSFYGPEEWKSDAARDSIPLTTIVRVADSLAAALTAGAFGDSTPVPLGRGATSEDDLLVLRQRYVARQLQALAARGRLLSGEKLSFDQESRALYDAVAPQQADSALDPLLARIDSLLPGQGALADRWEAYRAEFMIPTASLDTVFRVAIAEARRRTRMHVGLPDSESFKVEYVKGTPWGGYNWYQGKYRSLIQINTDLPVPVDRALDLACHEGYPGHHVYSVLLELELVSKRGWREFTVFPLYSPMALIAEGTAVVATEVAFPGEQQKRYEKEVLCPLAGIDTARYDRYAEVRAAMEGLSMAGVEGARRWLDGRATRDQTRDWLMRYAVRTRERAEKDLRFAERYRSYLVNYRLGRTIVLDWLAANGGGPEQFDRRWELYRALLASPRLPRDLASRP